MTAHLHVHERIHRHIPTSWYRLKAAWPFFIWLAAIVAFVWLYWCGTTIGTTSGLVETVRQEISPVETAPLHNLHVKVGDRVRRGDIVAEMDASVLGPDLAILKLQTERQFEDSVARIQTEMREARMKEAEIRGEYDVLQAEVKRLEGLLEKHLVEAQSVAELKARANALARLLDVYPTTLQDLENELKETQARAREANTSLGNLLVTNSVLGQAAAEGLNLLKQRRESYILRANRDGVISEVFHRPGDVVAAGVPIATVIEEQAALVIGFLPEVMAREAHVGMDAYLTHATIQGRAVKARVVALAPDILGLPSRINPVPSRSYRGRRIVLQPVEPNDFFPGESVNIQFDRPILQILIDHFKRSETADEKSKPAA
jgi:HlyD family secretion protein